MGEDGPCELELYPLAPEEPPAPPPEVSPPVVVVTEDEEIYCPVCGYNLSGNFSGRCSECGALFDRRALIAAQQANAITLIPWDDPEEMPFRERLYRSLRVCLLDAERFAFAFSVRPRESKAGWFFAGVVVVALVIGVAAAVSFMLAARLSVDLYAGFRDSLESTCSVGAFIALTIGMTTILTGAFLWIFCPHYDGLRHFRPWLSITAYAAAHYLLAGAMIPIGLILPFIIDRADGTAFVLVALCIWLGCAMLCVLTLRAVVDWRTAIMDAPGSVIFWIGCIHVGTAIVNLFPAHLLGELLAWVIRLFC